jgi:hypothetical protein
MDGEFGGELLKLVHMQNIFFSDNDCYNAMCTQGVNNTISHNLDNAIRSYPSAYEYTRRGDLEQEEMIRSTIRLTSLLDHITNSTQNFTPEEVTHVRNLCNNYRTNVVHNINTLTKPIPETFPRPFGELTEMDNAIIELVIEKIWHCVIARDLYKFFTQRELQNVVNLATRHDYTIFKELYNLPDLDIATNLAVLALYDIIILGDDSGSMVSREYNGITRFKILEHMTSAIAFAGNLFSSDESSIHMRFLNSRLNKDVKFKNDIDQLFHGVHPNGGTVTGRSLNMIFQDLVLPNMQRSALKKPTLIIILTDGVSSDNVNNTINNIKRITSQSQYGKNAVMFQFVQIGNDRGVPDMFNHIESDNPDIVNYVKNYDIEKAFRSREYCVSRYMVDVLTRFEFDDFDEEMVEERRSVFMERLPM